MKRNLTAVILISLCLFSCVSQDKYDKLKAEKDALQNELQELKFGAPNLLADAKKFFQAKDYGGAKEKLNVLLSKYPDRPESAEGKLLLSTINEDESWNSALNSSDLSYTETYISAYSTGRYVALAKDRLEELKVTKEKSAYENAIAKNSSSTWKEFINGGMLTT
jgi:hypothetical protein